MKFRVFLSGSDIEEIVAHHLTEGKGTINSVPEITFESAPHEDPPVFRECDFVLEVNVV